MCKYSIGIELSTNGVHGGNFITHMQTISNQINRLHHTICRQKECDSEVFPGKPDFDESIAREIMLLSSPFKHFSTRFFISNTYKQHQAEIGKKIKQMLSNTLRLNFFFIHIIIQKQ